MSAPLTATDVSAGRQAAGWRDDAARQWAARSPRERDAIGLVGVVLAAALVWWVGMAPALRTLKQAPQQLAAVEADLQLMQALAAETTALRGTPPVPTAQSVAALKAATEALGERASLAVQGDRVTLTMKDLDTAALRAWLDQARGAARARPVDAQWTRSANGYSGSLVLTVGTGP